MTKERLFNITERDLPSTTDLKAPQNLKSGAKRCRAVTLRRTLKSKVQPAKTGKEIMEEKKEKECSEGNQSDRLCHLQTMHVKHW